MRHGWRARDVTAQFKDVRAAEAAGYELLFGWSCDAFSGQQQP
jgi:hypothetical protein